MLLQLVDFCYCFARSRVLEVVCTSLDYCLVFIPCYEEAYKVNVKMLPLYKEDTCNIFEKNYLDLGLDSSVPLFSF